MAKVSRAVLKSYLERGDKPTQSQFATLIDSTLNIIEDGYLLGLKVYDPLKEYLSGDTTVYNGGLYVCIGATTGTFDPSKWQIITPLGSVVYAGVWDAATNTPTLSDSTGTKGFYYVVTVAGDQNLGSGTISFQIGDWAIYNGFVWQKVDNSSVPPDASNVVFTPNGSITATNVQDAIVEVRDNADAEFLLKADKVVGATTNDIAILDATGNLVDGGKSLADYLDKNNSTVYTPTGDYNPSTKKYVDDTEASKADKVVGATTNDIAILDATGNLVDGGKSLADYLDKTNTTSYTPTANFNPATKKYVDDADALKADKVVGATTNDIAILSATGNIVDGGKSLADYLDKANTTSYTPTGNFNPATKKYVDDADALKADKVVGATTNDIAILSVTGNLVDGGKKLTDYLDKANTTSYTPTANFNPATKKYVDDAVAAIPPPQKIVVIPFTFDTAYGTSAGSFVRVPGIQVIVPLAGEIFPGATTISAQLYVDYLTQSPTTTGEAGLTEWNFSGPPVSLVGTAATLLATDNAWKKNSGPPSFTLSSGKTYQVIIRKTAGTGQVQIEGAILVLTIS